MFSEEISENVMKGKENLFKSKKIENFNDEDIISEFNMEESYYSNKNNNDDNNKIVDSRLLSPQKTMKKKGIQFLIGDAGKNEEESVLNFSFLKEIRNRDDDEEDEEFMELLRDPLINFGIHHLQILKEGDEIETNVLFINNDTWDINLENFMNAFGINVIKAVDYIESNEIIELHKYDLNFFPMIFLNCRTLGIDSKALGMIIRNKIETEEIPPSILIGLISTDDLVDIESYLDSGFHMCFPLPLDNRYLMKKLIEKKLIPKASKKKIQF